VREVTAKGRTVETAVESALEQLRITKNQAEIIVVDRGKRGFLGFGAHSAIVKVKRLNTPIEQAKEYLLDVCEKMGAIIDIFIIQEGKNVLFQISGQKIAILIGKRGQTLNSLQYLTQLVINRNSDQYYHVQVNAEGYREKRKESLIQLAERSAHKAAKTGKNISLEPMPSEERKIIHGALASFKGVKTYSTGENSNRHIVVAPHKVK